RSSSTCSSRSRQMVATSTRPVTIRRLATESSSARRGITTWLSSASRILSSPIIDHLPRSLVLLVPERLVGAPLDGVELGLFHYQKVFPTFIVVRRLEV